jgi:GNAT superfamily N-acetyltransferase
MSVFGDHYHIIARGRFSAEQAASAAGSHKDMANMLWRAAASGPRYDRPAPSLNLRLLRIRVSGPASGERAVIEAWVEPSLHQGGLRVSKLETCLLSGKLKVDERGDIKVSAEWRRWGIGRIILSHWVEWARRYHPSVAVIPIYVVGERKADLRSFYRKLGFDWTRGLDHSDPVTPTDLRPAEACSIRLEGDTLIPAMWEALYVAAGRLEHVLDRAHDYERRLGYRGSLWKRLLVAIRPPR